MSARSYRRPSFRPIDLADISPAELERYKAEAQAVDESNRAEWQRRFDAHKQMLALASSVWTGDELKKAEKWLRGRSPEPCINKYLSNLADGLRRAEERKKAALDAKLAETAKAENLAQLARAVAYLAQRGKVVGTDYRAERAVSIADETAYVEEVDRLVMEGGPHDFSGQNCTSPCDGWDGESRRCFCGNRRVSWTRGFGHSFEKPYVYAEAY